MQIKTASFVISNTDPNKCPETTLPEYAFIGRSNVGKSSLINMLTNNRKLAKTSGQPGKTQLINHFMINDDWYLVDLPGYGFAKVAKTQRAKWLGFIREYLENRRNLVCVMVLVDLRLPAQKVDVEFMEYLGVNGIPFNIIFTKADKLTKNEINKNLSAYKKEILKTWEELPPHFVTSAESQMGKEEVLGCIEKMNNDYKTGFSEEFTLK